MLNLKKYYFKSLSIIIGLFIISIIFAFMLLLLELYSFPYLIGLNLT